MRGKRLHQRRQEKERQARQPEQHHAQEEAHIVGQRRFDFAPPGLVNAPERAETEEAELFGSDERHHEERQEAGHRPVVGHGGSKEKRGPVQPRWPRVETVFEQAPDHIGEHKQVQHFAGGADGVLPESQLQPQRDGRQDNRYPRLGHREQGVRVPDQFALLRQPVVRQQCHRARQGHEDQGGASGGERVERQRHPLGRQQTEREGQQEQQRLGEHGLPVPTVDPAYQPEVVGSHPVVERGQVNHQGGGANHPRQAVERKAALGSRGGFGVHASATDCIEPDNRLRHHPIC